MESGRGVMRAGALLLAVAWLGSAWAQQGIYTCIDGKGRRLTSDRPIPDCLDREQKELNASGTVRRNVGPSLTAQEQAIEEEKERRAAEERARIAEERRRERALLTRYPNRTAHDRERTEAIGQIDEVMKAASKRLNELIADRKAIDLEMEFYQKDPSKAPPRLRRMVDENNESVAVQRRFIASQEAEKARVNARFDEELVKLSQLWAMKAVIPAMGSTVKPASPSATR